MPILNNNNYQSIIQEKVLTIIEQLTNTESSNNNEYRDEFDGLLSNISKTTLFPTQCVLFSAENSISVWDGTSL